MLVPGTTLENEQSTRGVRNSISHSFKRGTMMLMTMRIRKIRQQWVLGFPGGAQIGRTTHKQEIQRLAK